MHNPRSRHMHSYHRAMAHLPRVWLYVICPFESSAIMKSGFFVSSLALVGLCMWTLDLFAAESSSLDSHAGAPSHGFFAVNRYGVSIGPTVQGSEFDQRE